MCLLVGQGALLWISNFLHPRHYTVPCIIHAQCPPPPPPESGPHLPQHPNLVAQFSGLVQLVGGVFVHVHYIVSLAHSWDVSISQLSGHLCICFVR